MNVKTKWLSSIGTAFANFGCQYNYQSIAVVLIMMSESECTGQHDSCVRGVQLSWVYDYSTAAIFLGSVCGQLTMGVLGDYFTRNRALMITLHIAIYSAILSAVAPTGSPTTVYIIIIFFRLVLGFGIGGIMPLSATKSAEDWGNMSGKVDPTASSWEFFWQMPALVAPWLLAWLLIRVTNWSISVQWRVVLGFGSIPLLISLAACIAEQYADVDFEDYLDVEDIAFSYSGKYRNNNHLSRKKMKKKKRSFRHGARTPKPKGSSILANDEDSLSSSSNNTFSDKSSLDLTYSPSESSNFIIPMDMNNGNVLDNESLAESYHTNLSSPCSEHFNLNRNGENPGIAGDPVSQLLTTSFDLELYVGTAEFYQSLVSTNNMYRLLSCGGPWLLYDIVSYGVNLLGGVIVADLTHTNDHISTPAHLESICFYEMIVMSTGIPATILGICLLPYIGLKRLQVIAFGFMAFNFLAMAISFEFLNGQYRFILFIQFILLTFSLQFGAGITTYSIPSTLFPYAIRSTANGICAAMGKIGAIIGSFGLYTLFMQVSYIITMWSCVGIAVLGCLLTFWCINEEEIMKHSVQLIPVQCTFTCYWRPPATLLTATTTTRTTSCMNRMRNCDVNCHSKCWLFCVRVYNSVKYSFCMDANNSANSYSKRHRRYSRTSSRQSNQSDSTSSPDKLEQQQQQSFQYQNLEHVSTHVELSISDNTFDNYDGRALARHGNKIYYAIDSTTDICR